MADWTSVAMFWATAGLVLVSLFATVLNYWLVRSSHDPHVVVYSASDPDRSTGLVLVVKNVGRGLAYDIRFDTSEPIPWKAWGVNEKEAKTSEVMEEGPLVDGIPLLAPQESRVMNWGQFGGLKAALNGRSIRITATYESRGVLPWNPTEHMTESVVEVDSFAGTVAHELPLISIQRELAKIRQTLDSLARGSRQLRARVQIEGDEKDPS